MIRAFGSYLRNIWDYRYFWFALVRIDLRTRYRRSVLGIAWSLLNPLAMTAVLCVVFHTVFHVDAREYGPFLLTGLAFWSFVSAVIAQGSLSFLQNSAYICQVPAPVAIYPLRTTLAAGFHFLIALAVALLFARIARPEGSALTLVSLVPTLLMLFILGWSLAILAAFANVYFPDSQHLLEVGLQIVFYMTPIIYPPEVLRNNPLLGLLSYNPLATLVGLVRDPILKGQVPGVEQYALAMAAVTLAACAASLTVARLRDRLVFRL
jgi:ABC-type polysaccharide/polyol phosphate export permease